MVKTLSLILFLGVQSPSFAEGPLEISQYGYLKDLMLVPHQNKRVRFKPVIKFWADSDQEYLRDTAKNAMQNALAKTLINPSEGLLKSVQKNIEAEILNEFILGLQILKITNSKMQFDLYFIPELDNPNSFDIELSSNNLVSFDESQPLTQALNQIEEPLEFYDKIKDYSKVIATQPGLYAYLGGVITIQLKILDLNLDLSSPIPDPKKNAVKGSFRIRRYYKVQNTVVSKNVHTLTLDATKETPFVTVDQYKTFNLGNLSPTPKYLEISFGTILDAYGNDLSKVGSHRKVGSGSWLSRIPLIGFIGGGSDVPVIKPREDNPRVNGEIVRKHWFDSKINFSIQKLVYDYEAKAFDRWRSTTLPDRAIGFKELIQSESHDLIDSLQLKRFTQ